MKKLLLALLLISPLSYLKADEVSCICLQVEASFWTEFLKLVEQIPKDNAFPDANLEQYKTESPNQDAYDRYERS